MKCIDALQMILGGDEGEFSPELKSHLAGCSECRRIHERNRIVLQLISLKRYEKPDPLADARCRARIREQITAPEPSFLRFGEILTGPAWAPLRMAAALALLALAGLYAVTSYQQSNREEVAQPVAVEAEPPALAAPMVADSKPVPEQPLAQVAEPILILASNQGPSGIQYGPQNSVPVRYEP